MPTIESDTAKQAIAKERKGSGYVYIFDTTLRDGEQCPGASMSEDQKLAIGHQLAKLKVDVIEAGFPISSPVQFQAVERIGRELEGPVIAALARSVKQDILSAHEALKPAAKKRIHTFIATSDIHMKHKLGKPASEVLKAAVEHVTMARDLVDDVEFSAEDASRSDISFLAEIIEAVIEAGATTINLPDTVGYSTPEEYGSIFKNLKSKVSNIDRAVLSAHCHNDLGLAAANSLSALQNGARQVECTVNGIGERAGNTAMEEVIMSIKTRNNIYPLEVGIVTEQIMKASRMVANFSGLLVQRNKAVVGSNAFAHESGIHQDGVLKNRLTYEIMTPESVGLKGNKIVLGRHSGRAAFRNKVKELGLELTKELVEQAYERFLKLADRKKEVFEEEIMALLQDESLTAAQEMYVLESFKVVSKSESDSHAQVTVKNLKTQTSSTEEMTSDGPISALFKALEKAVGVQTVLDSFGIVPASKGKDSLGEAKVALEIQGRVYHGRGISTDIFEASAKAFLNAIHTMYS